MRCDAMRGYVLDGRRPHAMKKASDNRGTRPQFPIIHGTPSWALSQPTQTGELQVVPTHTWVCLCPGPVGGETTGERSRCQTEVAAAAAWPTVVVVMV